jgi:hypothetical protein
LVVFNLVYCNSCANGLYFNPQTPIMEYVVYHFSNKTDKSLIVRANV